MSKIYCVLFFFSISAFILNAQNNCLDFDGQNDRIVMYTPITGSDDYTLEFYFKPAQSNVPNDLIVTWGEGNARYELRTGGGGEFKPYLNGTFYPTGISFTADTWYHIAASRSAGITRIYVDGNLVNTNNAGYMLRSALILMTWYGASFAVEGQMDEIRLWDFGRSGSAIDNSKDCTLEGTEAGLIGYWKLNQGVAGEDNTNVIVVENLTGNDFEAEAFDFDMNGNASNWVSSDLTFAGCCPIYCNGNNNFLGIIDADWNNDTNWSEGCVPSPSITGTIQILSDCIISSSDCAGEAYVFESQSSLVVAENVTFTNDLEEGLTLNGNVTNNGTIIIPELINNGTYSGDGQIQGNFVNNGTIQIGE